MKRPYEIIRLPGVSPVRSLCGLSYRLLPAARSPLASFHVVEIREAKEHYHRRSVEFYYILEGAGEMLLAGDALRVEPGMLIRIGKGTRHAGRGGFRALVVAVPAWYPDDECVD